jgi:hypothetical protein
MSNTQNSNLTNPSTSTAMPAICSQLKKIQGFNIPPNRFNLINPYTQYPNLTKFDFDMRRKAEVLKYSSNVSSSQTNNLTKKQIWSKIINGTYIPTATNPANPICPMVKMSSSASDVPGPAIMLYNDETIPLYNYITNSRSYPNQNPINSESWLSRYDNSVRANSTINYHINQNNNSVISSIYIISQPPYNTYTIKTPYTIHIDGSYNGTTILNFSISSITLTGGIYYNSTKVSLISSFNVSPLSLKIDLSKNNINNNRFTMDYYAGLITIPNISFPQQISLDTTVYDIQINLVKLNYTDFSGVTIDNSYITGNIPYNTIDTSYNCIITDNNNIRTLPIPPVSITT